MRRIYAFPCGATERKGGDSAGSYVCVSISFLSSVCMKMHLCNEFGLLAFSTSHPSKYSEVYNDKNWMNKVSSHMFYAVHTMLFI